MASTARIASTAMACTALSTSLCGGLEWVLNVSSGHNCLSNRAGNVACACACDGLTLNGLVVVCHREKISHCKYLLNGPKIGSAHLQLHLLLVTMGIFWP
ncbi:hypothetical protein B0T25DRAFT_209463 [Lasiosphaeria hispida]|uniref:Cyanovirin-N domain-containing protein n=1 Tax=Lasiosphaeria hispida TaxID=260671 RepID=A0AAJ0HJ75_9PEZI|nr:hypothetical protein B0T25DRAFT_209463 [Lasiosphaeria hispida]